MPTTSHGEIISKGEIGPARGDEPSRAGPSPVPYTTGAKTATESGRFARRKTWTGNGLSVPDRPKAHGRRGGARHADERL